MLKFQRGAHLFLIKTTVLGNKDGNVGYMMQGYYMHVKIP